MTRPTFVSVSLRWSALFVGTVLVIGGCDRDAGPRATDGSSPAGSNTADKPGDKSVDATPADAKPPKGLQKPQLFKLTPEEFATEFAKNPDDTHSKYSVGEVEITGTVTNVMMNFAGTPVVTLRGSDDKLLVQCWTKDPQPWAKLARGQTATIRGTVGYFPTMANIEKCEIVTAGEPTALSQTTAEAAEEYAKDHAAFTQSHANKDLILTGKVLDKSTGPTGIKLTLEGKGDVKVVCHLGMLESERPTTAQIQVGDTAKVFGELLPLTHPGGTVTINSAHLITQ